MIHERWSFKFVLQTKWRDFVLFSPSLDERNLWVHTFTWIIYRNEYLLIKNGKPEEETKEEI